MKRNDITIRRLAENFLSKLPKLGLPKLDDGKNGDLRIHNIDGISRLYGKVSNEWLQFGSGKRVGHRGRHQINDKVSDEHVNKLNVDSDLVLKGNINAKRSNTFISIDDDIKLNAARNLIVDKNTSGDSAEDSTGLYVDFDRTVAGSGTAAHNDIGIDVDVNAASLGSSTVKGIDIDVVGATSGTHIATGLEINVSGADKNYGLDITSSNAQLRLYASTDANDFATFYVTDTGDLSIATVGDGTTDSDLILDIDGIIKLDSADTGTGDGIRFLSAGTKFGSIAAHHDYSELRLYENMGASTNDYLSLQCAANGATKLITYDANAEAAHLTLSPDGDLILNPKEGKFIAQKDGTEFSAADSAYAGMALGYTYLQPSGSGESHALQTSFTVEDSTHQISFVVPPSGNIEIEATAFFDRSSTSDVTIYAGLSDNATYNSVGVGHEYDFSGALSDDEIDDEIITFKWCVTGLTAGASTTYYIGFKSSDASAVYLKYGIRASHGLSHHPFVIKAMALPAAIYDGS